MSTRLSPSERLLRSRLRPHRSSPLTPVVPPDAITPGVARIDRAPSRSRERDLEGCLDQTTYSCSCGYVFCAPVLTTVACPHCGVAQAW